MTAENRLMQKGRIAGALVKIGFAWLYGLAVTQLVLKLNHLPTDPIRQGLAGLFLIIVLAALTWQRYSLLALSGMMLLGSALAYWNRENWLDKALERYDQVRRWLDWTASWLIGQNTGTDQELTFLAMMICLALMVVSYFILARFNLPLLSMLILILVCSLNVGLSRRIIYPWMFLGGLSVVAACSRQQKHTFRKLGWRRYPAQARFMLQSVPLAAMAISLAVVISVLIPTTFFHSAGLEALADDVWGRITAIQSGGQSVFQDFTILSAGYYPLVDRLGGPVRLSNQPVMQVDGDPRPMLLRGSISRVYDGKSWRKDNNGQILRYDSPLWETDRIRTFDLDLPDTLRSLINPSFLYESRQYRLTPVSVPFQTVFLAGRPLNALLSPDNGLQLFFDNSGQMFVDGWLPVGQSVTVTARIMLTDQPNFSTTAIRAQVDLNQDEQDRYDQISQRYLQVPDSAGYQDNGELHQLVRQLTEGETEPIYQAQKIKEYLQSTCRYNLNVSIPPADADFVEWFLQTKEGYCVYFATAMTMLCRLADIPSRYVEGYYAPPGSGDDGSRIVTSRQAHAWSEIYLAGIGWIAIDATPGNSVLSPETTPSPSISATPTIAPDDMTPTPENPTDLTPEPTKPANPNQRTPIQVPWQCWLLLLLLPAACLAHAIWWYRRRHQRGWLRRRMADDRQLVLFYWQEIRTLLNDLGVSLRIWDTPRSLMSRVLDETSWMAGRRIPVAGLLQGLEKTIYSPGKPSDAELAALADLYDILEKTLIQNRSRLLFLLRRICYHRNNLPVPKHKPEERTAGPAGGNPQQKKV